ncbi:PAS domain-containing protein [Desertibaculum subflavum]|uniref:PAS domain-containing protein n=1 Tax=Desertibaculum subflavum TaxID=2268458 RepID=UPI000E672616
MTTTSIGIPASQAPTRRGLTFPWDEVTEESRRFAEAWLRWRGDRVLPRRSDMQLADIKQLLPLVSLLEARSPTEVVFRVAGSRLRYYLGSDLTGNNYVELAPESFRPIRIWRLQQQLKFPCGSIFIYPHRYPSGFVAPAETISLPIEDGRPGRPPMLLAVITPLTSRVEDPPPDGKREVQFAFEFSFLDIGAGMPGRILP